MRDADLAGCSRWDAWRDAAFSQDLAEPVGIVAAISEQSRGGRDRRQQRARADVV